MRSSQYASSSACESRVAASSRASIAEGSSIRKVRDVMQAPVHPSVNMYRRFRSPFARHHGTPCEFARGRVAHFRFVFHESHWTMGSLTHRVLIVEDDPEIQAALEELMTDEGYDVWLAANGADAIQLLEERGESPCAVLVDLLLPG